MGLQGFTKMRVKIDELLERALQDEDRRASIGQATLNFFTRTFDPYGQARIVVGWGSLTGFIIIVENNHITLVQLFRMENCVFSLIGFEAFARNLIRNGQENGLGKSMLTVPKRRATIEQN